MKNYIGLLMLQEGQTDLLEKIGSNALRYVRLIAEAADRLMPAATRTDLPEDVFDVLQRQVPYACCLTNCSRAA